MKVSFKQEKINLETFLSKLTPNTEITLVLQDHDECGADRTTLRLEGHPTRIIEMCSDYIGEYFIKCFGLEYGVFGTQNFVVKAVKVETIKKFVLTTDNDVERNEKPAETEDDDHIRFGDVVGFKPVSGDVTTGIVIDIRDGNAAILYQDRFESRLDVAYKRLEDLRRLKITYSEITEDVMEWLAN